MLKQAIFSKCNKYRYSLSRIWDAEKQRCLFIGLNPSTAGASEEDPTIRKLIAYTRSWGYGGFQICNLFAIRSSNPQIISKCDDPIGQLNTNYLHAAIASNHKHILIWGNWGEQHDDIEELLERIQEPLCLGHNMNGSPKHPLYLSKTVVPIPFKRDY